MFKKLFAIAILTSISFAPAIAEDAVFSNNETEQFNLQPLDYTTKAEQSIPVVHEQKETETISKPLDSNLSNQNYISAMNNLDNAQVQLREQMAAYSALMAQAKTNYEARKNEYKGYKKQYNQLKKNMRSVEKSKKLIQGNINVSNQQN